jgi:hypothetical protein
MTITFPDGRTIQGIVLHRTDDTLRAATRELGDIVEFHAIHGLWVSEEGEPVQIEFEWQRQPLQADLTESDFICSHDLAAMLVQLLPTDSGEEDTAVLVRSGARTACR